MNEKTYRVAPCGPPRRGKNTSLRDPPPGCERDVLWRVFLPGGLEAGPPALPGRGLPPIHRRHHPDTRSYLHVRAEHTAQGIGDPAPKAQTKSVQNKRKGRIGLSEITCMLDAAAWKCPKNPDQIRAEPAR
eukprot:gene5302-biopygen13250